MTNSVHRHLWFLVLNIAIGVFATPALSAPVLVRSGEHDGFTRLVFDLPQELSWEIERSDSSATLVLKGVDVEFNTSDTFRKLTANRITGLTRTPEKNGIDIDLNCDCPIEGFMHSNKMLVIDIRDPETARIGKRPKARPKTGGEASTISARPIEQGESSPTNILGPALAHANGNPWSNAREPQIESKRQPATVLSVEARKNETGTGHRTLLLESNFRRASRLQEAESRLLQQMGRAANQGLLSFHSGQFNLNEPVHAPSPVPFNDRKTEFPEQKVQAGTILKAETSADRDFAAAGKLENSVFEAGTCLSDSELDISEWASETPFNQQLGELRTRLVGEFDRSEPKIELELVRLYLHFGFGAEALQVLQASQTEVASEAVLRSIAQILESGHDRENGPFENQLECETYAAFWAVLASETPPPSGSRPNEASILRTLNTLPLQLRLYLGPIVSDRLVASGNRDSAELVLRVLNRGANESDSRIDLSGAKIHIANGNFLDASERLTDVVADSNELSPQALIALVDSKIAAKLPVNQTTAQLVEAYSLEYRNEPIGDELKRAHILTLCATGEFEQAFTKLENFSKLGFTGNLTDLQTQALEMLTETAPDMTFLKVALPYTYNKQSGAQDNVMNQFAGRLIKLGFNEQADFHLNESFKGNTERIRRVLRARSALAQNLPQKAHEELLGLDGNDIDSLRAEAFSLAGDYESAKRIYSELSQTKKASFQAWLSSDWGAFREPSDDFWYPVVEIITQPMPDREAHGILARDQLLLDHSSNSRRALSELLASPELQIN